MWLDAFPPTFPPTVVGAVSTAFVVAAMAVSMVAFSEGVGSQYDLKGSRAGLLLAIAGIISYLLGTSLQSDILHVLSIAVFYWGCVLSFGGVRPLASTLPFGMLVLTLFVPRAYGTQGLLFLEGLSWAVLIASAVLLWRSRRSVEPMRCYLCASFKERGEGFCGSCGRLIGPTTAAPSRKGLIGFAVFTVAMLALLILTVPLLTVNPTVSFVYAGLGGDKTSNSFVPLSGWGVRTQTLQGHSIDSYVLSNGKTSIQAFVAASQFPQVAASALNAARGNITGSPSLPPSLGGQMSGYTIAKNGIDYNGVQGVFQVGMLNGSELLNAFVAVDLRQTAVSFRADNGSALYGAAAAVVGWASASGQWVPTVQGLIWSYQFFAQAAYLCSFAVIVVIIFTVARDDELTKTRRLESTPALTKSEAAILRAFDSGPKWMTGEQIQDSAIKVDSSASDTALYSSLTEVSRRGLVSSAVLMRNGRPTLLWKRLFR
jgi:hypothetical protein